VEDQAGILFELSNGGTAVLNLDFLRPESAPTHGDDRLRVIGSEGVLEIREGGKRVELINVSGTRDIPLPETRPFFVDFVAELRGEGKHILSPEEPFEMTRVALLARESADRKRVLEL
jgi:predicted dehydrogenase